MNILRHKSWHVRTKKNIARVRRDEEKAKNEEEEVERRKDFAEKEARIEFLRNKAGHSGQPSNSSTLQHSNNDAQSTERKPDLSFELFEDYKDKAQGDTGKTEDEKIEQEKWEVKAGIFSYIDGRYKHDKTEDEQWYTKAAKDRRYMLDESKEQRQDKIKKRDDPLEKMNEFYKVIHRKETARPTHTSNQTKLKEYLQPRTSSTSAQATERTPSSASRAGRSSSQSSSTLKRKHRQESPSDNESGHNHRKRSRRKSKKHKRSRYSSSESSDSEPKVSGALIEKLRQQRLERERQAKEQTRIAFNLPDPAKKEEKQYNSQFNPHLVRK